MLLGVETFICKAKGLRSWSIPKQLSTFGEPPWTIQTKWLLADLSFPTPMLRQAVVVAKVLTFEIFALLSLPSNTLILAKALESMNKSTF